VGAGVVSTNSFGTADLGGDMLRRATLRVRQAITRASVGRTTEMIR